MPLSKNCGGAARLRGAAGDARRALRCVDRDLRRRGGIEIAWSDARCDRRPRPRECRRAGRLIRALCDLERQRSPFAVRDTEMERTLALAGAQLRVRIDRIDELESGGLAILDYKSGRPGPGDW